MAIETDADRAVFFDTADFGETATWTVGSIDTDISALFDDNAVKADAYGELPMVQDRMARLTFRESDLPAGAAKGNAVSVGGSDYTVKSIEPDGLGIIVAMLEAA